MKAIEITNLTKYYGKAPGIRDVSFDVERGEVFGFIGPNGAGKSTTIRTLLNLIFPTSGSARIFGMDIVKDTKKIKKIAGYLPAEGNYYHKMTVRELLEYSARFYGLKDCGTRMNYLCDALTLDLDRKISDLSSGNKKKVSIVQSLLHSPELLILDEPTSGLDPLVQAAFYEILHDDNGRGMTIFFSSHVLSEVQRICDRVAIIRNHRVVRVEHIETLKKNLLKKVSIVFRGEAPEKIDLPGVAGFGKSRDHASFMFDGDINALLKHFAGFGIVNMAIEEPTLDEVFMHFYENHGGENVN